MQFLVNYSSEKIKKKTARYAPVYKSWIVAFKLRNVDIISCALFYDAPSSTVYIYSVRNIG